MSTLKYITTFCLLAGAHVYGEAVSYEGTSFPDEQGWVRSDRLYLADRWLEKGWFVQHTEIADPGPPIVSEDDFYAWSLTGFIGTPSLFLEWCMETDGSREGFPNVSPAVIVAGGRFGVSYHFTIARDQVRLIRDNLLPIVFVDFEPGSPHTYRLELYGGKTYIWYIDGQVADSGLPEGAYPTEQSEVKFGASAAFGGEITRWDYVRFGAIPEDGAGDYDTDAEVALDDFYFFHECLSNRRPGINGGPGNDSGPGCRFADFDFDNDVDLLDVAEFQLNFTGDE